MTKDEAQREALRALGITDEFDCIAVRAMLDDIGEFSCPPTPEQEEHLIRLGAFVWPIIGGSNE